MGLGGCKMLLDPGDLLPQQLDPLVEFGDRQRPEILLADQGQRIGRPGGKEVVLVHGQ